MNLAPRPTASAFGCETIWDDASPFITKKNGYRESQALPQRSRLQSKQRPPRADGRLKKVPIRRTFRSPPAMAADPCLPACSPLPFQPQQPVDAEAVAAMAASCRRNGKPRPQSYERIKQLGVGYLIGVGAEGGGMPLTEANIIAAPSKAPKMPSLVAYNAMINVPASVIYGKGHSRERPSSLSSPPSKPRVKPASPCSNTISPRTVSSRATTKRSRPRLSAPHRFRL